MTISSRRSTMMQSGLTTIRWNYSMNESLEGWFDSLQLRHKYARHQSYDDPDFFCDSRRCSFDTDWSNLLQVPSSSTPVPTGLGSNTKWIGVDWKFRFRFSPVAIRVTVTPTPTDCNDETIRCDSLQEITRSDLDRMTSDCNTNRCDRSNLWFFSVTAAWVELIPLQLCFESIQNPLAIMITAWGQLFSQNSIPFPQIQIRFAPRFRSRSLQLRLTPVVILFTSIMMKQTFKTNRPKFFNYFFILHTRALFIHLKNVHFNTIIKTRHGGGWKWWQQIQFTFLNPPLYSLRVRHGSVAF